VAAYAARANWVLAVVFREVFYEAASQPRHATSTSNRPVDSIRPQKRRADHTRPELTEVTQSTPNNSAKPSPCQGNSALRPLTGVGSTRSIRKVPVNRRKRSTATMANAAQPRRLARSSVYERVVEIMGALPGGQLLDVPAGSGLLSRRLAALGFEVTCSDINAEDFAASELPFEQADLSKTLPFEDASFDCVTCIEGLEHLENPFQAVRELARVLRPGGTLVLSIPNYLNIERRLKFLITGSFTKPVPSDRLKELGPDGVAMLHLSPVGYPQVKLMLELAGLRVDALFRDRAKVKQMLLLWPLVLLIKLYTRLWPRRARWRYLLDELEGPALLTGGNTLIIQAQKPTF